MRILVVMGLLATAGCDRVFGLERVDAAIPPACPPPPPMTCGLGAADEDGDQVPDGCDPCPQFADAASNTDSDGDGVGDECDPAPVTPAACRSRFFYGFATGDGWIDSSGWTFGGAADRSQASAGLGILRSNEAHLTGRATIEIEDGKATKLVDSLAGVAMLADADHAYACAINPDPEGAIGALVVLEIQSGAESVRMRSSTFAATPGLSHRVWLELAADGTLQCRSSASSDGHMEATLSLTVPLPLIPASVGVVARHSASSVEYLDFVPF